MKDRRTKTADTVLSREIGSVRKKWTGRLPVALVFPNTYKLGMSNLGFQLLYEYLNNHQEIVCERIFLTDGHPTSVESNRPLADFPIVFISVSFEQDFPNIVRILELAGIDALAADRQTDQENSDHQPLIVGGGVATFINPEPLAPFFDLFLIGEVEPVIEPFIDLLIENQEKTYGADFLYGLATSLPGSYVPSLYQTSYNDDGTFAGFLPADGVPEKIKKLVADADAVAGHSTILSPEAEFSDIFLTELGRGCSRGCRFCAAGYVYRPPRLWSAESIITAIAKRPEGTRRVGLLGMEMASSQDLEIVAAYLLNEQCALSFSSLRADIISPTILALLGESSLKSAAIAPDGSSERLRQVISKNITAADILAAAKSLVEAGIKNLKLYFMIGLPTEGDDDLAEMVKLVKEVHAEVTEIGRARGHLSEITLSINSFVPKAWTPFQFAGFEPVIELKKKIKYLRKALAGLSNLKINVDNPDKAFFQAVMARADRRVAGALVEMSRSGRNWRQVFKEMGCEPESYACRQRGERESFPWEIIDNGISRKYLWAEYQMALKDKPSKGCGITSQVKCRRCGVCK